ncbi:hypothetical protein J5N97_009311 [Dioscorea zingiberensis]|uniref:Late embryogenesis abundant protein LEA-2 subgroup domain-containing protein n=1 Tax=Dioscorea zingiberensis TaxID=325984 RepID=A0A9D5CWY4_9LILI|nr:hypothetical protein J5N97_009311 [Dioscorea zingiberensis]
MSSQTPQPIFDKLEGTGLIKKHHDQSYTSTSFRRLCCLFTLILLNLEALVAATLIILIFVFRPKEPIFHLHSIKFQSFNLNTNSSQQFNASSSVASLVLVTENPNKLGIRYNSSELAVLYEQQTVGVIEVPVFYQPPSSRNVTVEVQVSYQPWQVINIINGISVSSNDTTNGDLRIFGGIQAQPHALNFPLLTIKDKHRL